jgi:hypothetical protein
LNYNKNNNISNSNYNIFDKNSLSYNKNNNIYNTNNYIFDMNTLNYKKNNNIFNTNNYINKPKTQEPWLLIKDPKDLSSDARPKRNVSWLGPMSSGS